MGTEILKFDYLKEALVYVENYFKEFPGPIFDTECKISFERSKYQVILNKFDWSNDE